MRRILIIEDDALIARVYASKYLSAGFETKTAADGEVGLELLNTFKPDLVHLDLSVPKVNGVEIVKQIRSRPETRLLPVIVLSNTYQNRLVKGAIEAGATQCVSKATCTPKMMVEIVERIRARMSATQAPPEAIAALSPEAVASPAYAGAPESAEPGSPPAADPSPATAEAPPLSPPPPSPDHAYTSETHRHFAFQAEIQRDFLKRGPDKLKALRERVELLLRAETEAAQIHELSELCRVAHQFAGHAGIAGFQQLAQMAYALVALLKELLENPKALTPSSMRTIVDACDFLSFSFESAAQPEADTARSPIVLVIDDEVISRRAVCLALARLNVATVSVDDPQVALRLLAENRFNLIFLDVEMPGRSGFDVCEELRTIGANQETPVVFVSGQADDAARERCAASGGNDLIGKPFLPMELAVKALSLLRQNKHSGR